MSKYQYTEWINSTGGPLVALEEECANEWTGIQGDPSDYEIACQTKDYVDIVRLHGSEVLVFGDEPLQTLVAHSETSIFVVRWMWAESENDVFSEIEKIDQNIFDHTKSINIRWKSQNIVLFDASSENYKEESYIRFKVHSNTNQVSSVLWAPNDKMSLLIHKITPIMNPYQTKKLR